MYPTTCAGCVTAARQGLEAASAPLTPESVMERYTGEEEPEYQDVYGLRKHGFGKQLDDAKHNLFTQSLLPGLLFNSRRDTPKGQDDLLVGMMEGIQQAFEVSGLMT